MKPNLSELLPLARASSFRLFLQAELARRCAANPQYSLRSSAQQLGINHSTLSQLLRGKRALPPRTIVTLGGGLGLKPEEVEAFAARERLSGSLAGNAVTSRAIRDLTLDTVALLSDSSHRAILELTTLPDFRPDSRWIARTLDLTVDEVNTALSRLTRLGLLEMAAPNRWVDRSGAAAESHDGFAQLVIRRLSEQARRLSVHAMADAGAPDEAPATTNLVINAAQLPALLELLERLQREAAQQPPGAQQYQLELNLKLLNPPS